MELTLGPPSAACKRLRRTYNRAAMEDSDRARIDHVAALARLYLSEEERARFAPEFARLLAAFEVLARAPRAAEAAPDDLGARSRPDIPQPPLAREALLAAAPAVDDGFFLVPKTVGGAP
jgi:aspartyl-tRNA(Asn)/glutamyl-tRNA(Gln) amidotransferase subunit C